MRDDDEMPDARGLLLRERWEALQERKRLARRNGQVPTKCPPSAHEVPTAAPAPVMVHANVDPAASPVVKAAVVELVQHVHATMAAPKPKPTYTVKQLAKAVGGLVDQLHEADVISPRGKAPKAPRPPAGKTYDNVMRAIGRPCTQREIAERSGSTVVSVSVWLRKHGKGAGVIDIGEDLTATTPRKPRLYMLED